MGETKASNRGGIGVIGALGVLFVALKLCGVLDWPWLWVTVPFWGGLALVLAVLTAAFPFMVVATVRERRAKEKRLARAKERAREWMRNTERKKPASSVKPAAGFSSLATCDQRDGIERSPSSPRLQARKRDPASSPLNPSRGRCPAGTGWSGDLLPVPVRQGPTTPRTNG